jgi:FkbM family methyltransferase
MPRYYSQHGEDCLLWTFFGERVNGFYVDVGAFDGRYVSNTYAFEQMGWHGICVEPHPVSFKILRELRTAICVNAACVPDPTTQHATLYMEKLGYLSGLQGEREDDVNRRYEKRGLTFDGFDTVDVPAMTLDRILSENVPGGKPIPIDFLSVDVEGTELDVLRGLDLNAWRPRVLLIETNTPAAWEAMSGYLSGFGYSLARRLAVNSLYVRDPRDVERIQSISVKCWIEPTPHPFGAELTPQQHVTGYQVNVPAEVKPVRKSRLRRLIHRLFGK